MSKVNHKLERASHLSAMLILGVVAIAAFLVHAQPSGGQALPQIPTTTSRTRPLPVSLNPFPLAATPTPECGFRGTLVPGAEPGIASAVRAVAGSGYGDVWIAGIYNTETAGHPLTEHWDGSSWTVVPAADNPQRSDENILLSLAEVSPNNVWAVGGANQEGFTPFIEHWDGGAWSVVPYPSPGPAYNHKMLRGVHAIASDDVWAVGYYNTDPNRQQTLTLHWNGSAWAIVPSPNVQTDGLNQLSSVSAFASNDVWAVGTYAAQDEIYHTLVMHWNGTSWNIVPSPDGSANANLLNSVTAVGPNQMWAVGTLALNWDGSSWGIAPNLGSIQLFGVSAASPGDVWMAGASYPEPSRPALLHWDGTILRSVPALSRNNGLGENVLFGVKALASGAVWAVGIAPDNAGQRRELLEHYDDPCSTPAPVPTPTTPRATPTPCTAGSFSDVPSDNTFYPYITCLVNRGVVSGYGDCTFKPNNQVTRGQLAKIVSNAANFQEDPGVQIFEDVALDSTFYQWINRLTRRGYMSGYTCGGPGEPCVNGDRPYFRPSANATRGQTAKIVSNAKGYIELPNQQTFEDVPPDYTFYEWIQRLASHGAMGGYTCGGPGELCGLGNRPYFRPGNNVTRGQSAKIVGNTFFPDCQTP